MNLSTVLLILIILLVALGVLGYYAYDETQSAAGLAAQLKQAQNQIADLQNQIAALQNQIVALKDQLATAQSDGAAMKTRIDELNKQIENLNHQISVLEVQVKDLTDKLASLQATCTVQPKAGTAVSASSPTTAAKTFGTADLSKGLAALSPAMLITLVVVIRRRNRQNKLLAGHVEPLLWSSEVQSYPATLTRAELDRVIQVRRRK